MGDFNDVTVIIPISFDSIARLRNLKLVLRYLIEHLDCPIMVCEDGPDMKGEEYLKDFRPRIKYLTIDNPSIHHHRTRCLNTMAKAADTPYLLSHDADVLTLPEKYGAGLHLARQGCHMSFPHSGQFLNVPGRLATMIHRNLSLEHVRENDCSELYSRVFSGAVFLDKKTFVEAGMENENIKGWGCEDDERAHRYATLGYKISLLQHPLYHLDHPRGETIGPDNPRINENDKELQKVRAMPPDVLRKYVNSWNWVKG